MERPFLWDVLYILHYHIGKPVWLPHHFSIWVVPGGAFKRAEPPAIEALKVRTRLEEEYAPVFNNAPGPAIQR